MKKIVVLICLFALMAPVPELAYAGLSKEESSIQKTRKRRKRIRSFKKGKKFNKKIKAKKKEYGNHMKEQPKLPNN